MSDQTVNPIVSQLVHADRWDAARLAELLAATFKPGSPNPFWNFYTFELKAGPFVDGQFQLSQNGQRALLSLNARETPGILEADLDLSQWGAVIGIKPKPDIPPEGADAYIYQAKKAKVSFQFTHESHRLLSVALEWGAGVTP